MAETVQCIVIREATDRDLEFMEQMARQAIFPSADPPADAGEHKSVRWFIDDWGRDRDFGAIAVNDVGNPIGAAWARQVTGAGDADPLPGAELIIAVEQEHRNSGVGARLIESLCDRGRGLGLEMLVLVVSESSPAQRLYGRCGFWALEGANVEREWADPDDPELVMPRRL